MDGPGLSTAAFSGPSQARGRTGIRGLAVAYFLVANKMVSFGGVMGEHQDNISAGLLKSRTQQVQRSLLAGLLAKCLCWHSRDGVQVGVIAPSREEVP